MLNAESFFWQNPPWGDGEKKYRLGLQPIEFDQWLNRKIDEELLQYKRNLLESKYNQVIATTEDSLDAQKKLAAIFGIKSTKYPDLIAELGINIQDDLCLMQSKDEQRLLAASICSPSYWDVKTKIGKSLKDIHGPVTSLNEKIGDRISTFIRQAPLKKPFARQNWLVHGNTKRFHIEEEETLKTDPSCWFIRTEKETICRYHEDYSLFTINVFFEPLNQIHNFPEAKNGLLKSLESFDDDEAEYFGGIKKIDILLEYLKA